jgi:hypothetical protein
MIPVFVFFQLNARHLPKITTPKNRRISFARSRRFGEQKYSLAFAEIIGLGNKRFSFARSYKFREQKDSFTC